MPISTRLLLLASLAAAPGVIPLYLLYRTTTHPGSAIQGNVGIPSALEESKIQTLLNPRGNPLMVDSWTYRIRKSDIPWLSSSPSETSEEKEERLVLARFVRGFFHGKAFAFEEWLFNTFKQTLSRYIGGRVVDPNNRLLAESAVAQQPFWSSNQWPIDDYPPYGAAFLSSFTLLDSGRDRIYADDQLPRTFSAISFGSNRPRSQFVGIHFFSVIQRRVTGKHGLSEDVFDLNIWSFNCDPSENGANGKRPRWLWAWLLPNFHYMYERALMADGIDAVRGQ
ncbi:hypothetical protein CALVIDRAFT_602100 [Calocera viscosa TUFC12733]|uniref:Uncharacterized protein n=1 Tax=Calocera viscosa (strain TUFC12733) TaxID=1330018 RepID=A0A167HH24_CALVF|nr:hypothetical protein CALVIDRAFT_602100 [Calocera viscosa TUFC12733]